MASSVFFKFKSQKEPQRVTFDGTGISVYELKRDIINLCKLGDGTDFDLIIYNEDNDEEYDDDTTIIPRSTTVVARRLPAAKPGQGRAARYVSGRMPINAKTIYRSEQSYNKVPSSNIPSASASSGIGAAQTEEEKIAAVHKLADDQWQQQKQQMSSATPVFRPGAIKGKPTNVPEGKPPPAYICHRCGEKDHWIQECPTNGDPNYDGGKHRFKRTTGIPRSFLKTVEKPSMQQEDGLTDESKQPTGIMRDADGKYVIALPDQASWEKYQSKAQASVAASGATGNDKERIEMEKRGFICPIDKRLFVDPTKTPCCGTTFCSECIENALANNDLVCPSCSTQNVLFDNLTPDDEMRAQIEGFEKERKAEKKLAENTTAKSDSPRLSNVAPAQATPDNRNSKSPALNNSAQVPVPEPARKRGVEDETAVDQKSPHQPPPAKAVKTSSSNVSKSQQTVNGFDQAFIDEMNALAPPDMNMNFNSSMPMIGLPMGMNMQPMMGLNPQMMNPMMMMGGMGMPQWPMGGNMFPGPPTSLNMNINSNGMPYQQNGYGSNNATSSSFSSTPGMSSTPRTPKTFSNQPAPTLDNPYMRAPLNPHRHQNRQKRTRPTDYREL